MVKLQNTLTRPYTFTGKGLHTGKVSTITVRPAPADTGIRFHRIDLGESAFVDALAENVSSTARSTTISSGTASVMTIEHLLSALTGLDIDNALVEIDGPEVPILDGSAKPYIDAIVPDGVETQSVPRHYVEIDREFHITNDKGAKVKIEPADEVSYDILVDFNSRVMGVQTAHWDPSVNYGREIGTCRTFCFFHEIEFLLQNNLIKGGDVDNALVIVEHPVSEEQVRSIAESIGRPEVRVAENGYLSNVTLRFANECARHKLLDLMGDLRLCGGFLKARVTAEKAGHSINTSIARQIREYKTRQHKTRQYDKHSSVGLRPSER